MPVTLVTPLCAERRLSGLITYLADDQHPNHQEYLIESQLGDQAWNTRSFATRCARAVEHANSRKKNGRPIKNLAFWFMLRFPDGAWLSKRERYWFGEKQRRRFAPDGTALIIWHINQLTGSADLNLVVSNVGLNGETRRTRERNFRREAIFLSDQLTARLNRRRGALELDVMIEMPDRIAELRGGHNPAKAGDDIPI